MKRHADNFDKQPQGNKKPRHESDHIGASVPVFPQMVKALCQVCVTTRKPEMMEFIGQIKNKDIEDTRKGLCLLTDEDNIRTWRSGFRALLDCGDIVEQASKFMKKIPKKTQNMCKNAMEKHEKTMHQDRDGSEQGIPSLDPKIFVGETIMANMKPPKENVRWEPGAWALNWSDLNSTQEQQLVDQMKLRLSPEGRSMLDITMVKDMCEIIARNKTRNKQANGDTDTTTQDADMEAEKD
ncbi:hypothetical protein A1F94_000073 [Pyrenophora tritici-repentis]|uniref:Uncharacterized protein n=3 Tax=Pyrenophora tritici-repentis TaxID=45151 RepID=A0A2W1E192_9PLEO|nr:uncharacterized protein PTRG_00432 [Pyrenophora tritici-repentis Pt-1C-BFP]KAA8625032.1 hypothetical protein PtrV1_00712 [Pyrenophora tritici-repentis]EDU39870.1 hypothetical protein PTRG_00432 [Pyrenophora tritici-repentis Pt-1C-BFP]KAF7453426.1 hypothetical protein A1F99_006840 [Pyrenophora tritici-repentis]KAG9387181.1 hypothetical protein A1F94_000073 [Pyrenophora tritici-repentis]KAI0588720.1 hypothetical protein Alg130_03260 [Pyrenophora tritici-repentis]